MPEDIQVLSFDRRKYKRLKMVLPVEFTIVRPHGDLLGINWEQGTTVDVSQGGLCLKTKVLNESSIRFLHREDIHLELKIFLPKEKNPIRIIGRVAWFKTEKRNKVLKYVIGIEFRSIISSDLKKILKHAQ